MILSYIQTPHTIYHILKLENNEANTLTGWFWIFLIIALIIGGFIIHDVVKNCQFHRWSVYYDRFKHRISLKRKICFWAFLFIASFCLGLSFVASPSSDISSGSLTYSDPQSLSNNSGMTATNVNSKVPYSNKLIVRHDLKYYHYHHQIEQYLKNPSELKQDTVSTYSWRKTMKPDMVTPADSETYHLVVSDYNKLNKYYYYPVHTFMQNHPCYNIAVGLLCACWVTLVFIVFIAVCVLLWLLVFWLVRQTMGNTPKVQKTTGENKK